MKVTAALLCDAATVREGLLHVLGAGLTHFGREAFPARMDCDFGLALEVEEGDVRSPHTVRCSVHSEDGDETYAVADLGFGPGEAEGPEPLPQALAAVLSLRNVGLPKPGRYFVSVNLDDNEAVRLNLIVYEVPQPDS